MGIEDKVRVVFQPSGRRGEVEKGISVIEASRRLGVDIEVLCGERKSCGKCKVQIEEGYFEKSGLRSSQEHLSPWQEEEAQFINEQEKAQGYRLGCAAKISGDLVIFVPEESRPGKPSIGKAARDIHINWDPAVKYYFVEVEPASFANPAGDFERVRAVLQSQYGLGELEVDLPALRTLPGRLREGGWKLTVGIWMDKEVIRFLAGCVEDYYGLAVDLGTTTCAVYLCHLRTKEVLHTASMMNPQCKYGEDVISRITYHIMNRDGLERMRSDVVEGLNELVRRCCEAVSPAGKHNQGNGGVSGESREYPWLDPEDIVDMTLVGNTAMHHIFLGLDPRFLGLSPFTPVIHQGLDVKARDLGIKINPSAYVHVLPVEAGYVGADNVGVLIAEEPYQSDELQLIIDIGTNGELVLGDRHKLISASCATGPALEGAQITWGMRASSGAIERLTIEPGSQEVDYKVIGREAWKSFSQPEEMQAKGLCGSGILDLLAELYLAGVIDKTGRFIQPGRSKRLRKNSNDPPQSEFVLAWAQETSVGQDIVVTQKDIRQIQLAKGALYAGCKLLMRRLGVDKVEVIKVAGAFGTNVDPRKALIMGLFPDCEIGKIKMVGNAAGDGARAALLDRRKRKEAEWCARHVEYIELTLEPDFLEEVTAALYIPHQTDG
ncbi:MAG: ASKHA domain-containing protein, partial [Pseudomonadota bacterium]